MVVEVPGMGKEILRMKPKQCVICLQEEMSLYRLELRGSPHNQVDNVHMSQNALVDGSYTT